MSIIGLTKMKEGFMVWDQSGNRSHYGGNQQWLSTDNGVLGGCGTVAAANLTAYLAMTRGSLRGLYAYPTLSKPFFLRHMEEVYQVVTPLSLTIIHQRLPAKFRESLVTTLGIPGIVFFAKRVKRFAGRRGVELKPVWVDKKDRPRYNTSLHLNRKEAVSYIRQGLQQDCPVIMLNGFNPSLVGIPYGPQGKQPYSFKGNFQRHWVVITGLKEEASTGDTFLEVATWGCQATLSMDEFWGKGYTGLVYFRGAVASPESTGR